MKRASSISDTGCYARRVGLQSFGGIALSGTGIQAGGPDYLKQLMWMQSDSQNIMRKGLVPDGD